MPKILFPAILHYSPEHYSPPQAHRALGSGRREEGGRGGGGGVVFVSVQMRVD